MRRTDKNFFSSIEDIRERELLDELEGRLVEWSKFFRSNPERRLGYPDQSVYIRALTGDGVNSRREPENARAEEVEIWVVGLAKISSVHKKWKDALCEKYFNHWNFTNTELGKKLGISGRTFEERVYNAKNFLLGCLAKPMPSVQAEKIQAETEKPPTLAKVIILSPPPSQKII